MLRSKDTYTHCTIARLGYVQYISEVGAPDVSAAVPIACLYPSVPDFYRKLGFEVAGSMWEVEFDMSTVRVQIGACARLESVLLAGVIFWIQIYVC